MVTRRHLSTNMMGHVVVREELLQGQGGVPELSETRLRHAFTEELGTRERGESMDYGEVRAKLCVSQWRYAQVRPTLSREFALRLAKQEARRLAGGLDERSSRPKKRRKLAQTSGDSSSDEVEIIDGPSTSRRPDGLKSGYSRCHHCLYCP